ncbi:SUMF1/EgtB/PvdO family nonheme iron enzyme [Zhongshania sp.]|uniref:SUMF1/EgtB/PvdO family nonheme iron enzyme n=1 Tax=Zhongshania sp. TaxID=1971902 RepID=UPI003568E586
MSDSRVKALKLLGLEKDAPSSEIDDAYYSKRTELQLKQQGAPTPALADKFADLIAKLDTAYQQLFVESAPKRQQAAGSLSQTKLADLPGVDPVDKNRLSFEPGHLLAGRYTIAELIGQGGMGAVYRAHDKNRDEDIAIKVLLPSLTNNERALARFMDEARISSKLSHANIVNVYDVQNDGELYFLTMELLEGQGLRQVMENQKLVGRPMDIEDVKGYLNQICMGLSAAHEYTIHRDIKPENIWLGDDGKLKLMDFGIAQLQSTSRRTQTGAAMGTAYYMAPEQLKGLKDIDGRADQYAVGVLTYELLTGEVPAGAIEPVNELRKDIPKGMAAAIMQSLSPRPEKRFDSIGSFAEAVEKDKGTNRYKATNTTNPVLSNGPNKWVLASLVLLLFIGLGAIAGTGVWQDWLPASKEEIAREKAAVAKLQGEIKVIKQRLDTARRNLDSDVRDAQRNKSNQLTALKHWQDLTETAVFNGNQIPELEGELAVGETLLREGSYSEAQVTLSSVRDGYQRLYIKFSAAEKLYPAQQVSASAAAQWAERKHDYKLEDPLEVGKALAAESLAKQQQYAGDFESALDNWQRAELQWQAAHSAVSTEVAAIDQQWAKAAAERKAAVARQAAAERKAVRDRKQAALLKKLNIAMVSIPSGSFRMGDLNGDGDADEKPVHKVSVSAFSMSKHEITFAQWDACVSAGGCSYRPDDEGQGRGDYPVVYVSWNDINQEFIPWLNKATGKRFRLPSEAEWEYAARAGTTTSFSTGNCISTSQANYDGRKDYNSCGAKTGVDRNETLSVGSFNANRFGLYDTHGNVSEWTQDCRNKSYVGAPSNGGAWTDGDCNVRVLRGGSFLFGPATLRVSERHSSHVTTRHSINGFRLAHD